MGQSGGENSEVVQMTDEVVTETGQTTEPETGNGTGTESGTDESTATSVINLAVESVAALINDMNLFATITRGALGIGNSLCCEVAPSATETVFMDKEYYLPLTLAINGKHDNLQTLSDALDNILDTLSMSKTYPSGTGWEIVDITAGNQPRVIGREDNNQWLMNADVIIKIYRKDEADT